MLWPLPSKYIQNPVTSHHLPQPNHHHLLPGFVRSFPPCIPVCILSPPPTCPSSFSVAVASLISQKQESDHALPYCRTLQWLPVLHRIKAKVLAVASRASSELASFCSSFSLSCFFPNLCWPWTCQTHPCLGAFPLATRSSGMFFLHIPTLLASSPFHSLCKCLHPL